MKWFKHMSDMADDVKVKRLRRKYGVEGYGLYNYIIERIVKNLQKDSPLPELEEEAQDIAGELGMDTLKVEEIMKFAISQGLFTVDEVTGRLVAHKVYKFLEESTTRNEELKAMIKNYKDSISYGKNLQTSDTVSDSLGQSETVSDNPGLSPDCQRLSEREEKRREENRTEEKNIAPNGANSHTLQPSEPGQVVVSVRGVPQEHIDLSETALEEAKLYPVDKPSRMKDALADQFETLFWAVNGQPATIAKERQHCNKLSTVCRARSPDNEVAYANAVVEEFYRLTLTSRKTYWRCAFTAANLVNKFDAVADEVARKVQEHANEIDEVVF